MRETTRWMVLATAVVTLASWSTARAQSSPYESLDPGKLARELRERGMTELLEEFSKSLTSGKGADSIQVLQMSAEQQLALAGQQGISDAKRKAFRQAAADAYAKLYKKIEPKLGEIVGEAEKCSSDNAKLALKYFHRTGYGGQRVADLVGNRG